MDNLFSSRSNKEKLSASPWSPQERWLVFHNTLLRTFWVKCQSGLTIPGSQDLNKRQLWNCTTILRVSLIVCNRIDNMLKTIKPNTNLPIIN